MSREVRTVLRSLFILAQAGSKDFCRRLRVELFKQRHLFPYEKWRKARERKRRLEGRAKVGSWSSGKALSRGLRFSGVFERQQFGRELVACKSVVGDGGKNRIVHDGSANQFSPLGVGETLKERRDSQDRWHISRALDVTKWNKTAAARKLGMRRQTLHERMKALGMSVEKP